MRSGHNRMASSPLVPHPTSVTGSVAPGAALTASPPTAVIGNAAGASSALPPPPPGRRPRRHVIAMVSDFFYPGFGGVEIHIYNLALCLMRRQHKVVVITRAYGDRNGVRYLTHGLKVYHLPFVGVRLPPGTVTLPTVFGSFPLLRNIFIREGVTIVHGHQTTSNLCHEAMLHGGTMGLKVCFTDHSLFGFADAASIHINKVLLWSLRCVDQVICVSNTSRENTVLRAHIPPHRVSVIPNATDTSIFTPPDSLKYKTWAMMKLPYITIVVVTRLVYRKGSDLFVDVIPTVCKKYPNVRWIIGGDGPRRQQLALMIDRHHLGERVQMLGELKHADVKHVLNQGQIFLNCSLTEAFCIAIIEAASCGLIPVSTRVGGVPEVLPSPELLLLAEPEPNSICKALDAAIARVPTTSPWDIHDNVRRMYAWPWVAERTERVYDRICEEQAVLPAGATSDESGVHGDLSAAASTSHGDEGAATAAHVTATASSSPSASSLPRDAQPSTARSFWTLLLTPNSALKQRLLRYRGVGSVFTIICICISAMDFLVWCLLEWYEPASEIELAVDFPAEHFVINKDKLLSHRTPPGSQR